MQETSVEHLQRDKDLRDSEPMLTVIEASLTKIKKGLNATANAGANQFFIHSKSATEYFVIENRHQSARDKSLPASGLAIWHIDELGDNQNEQMTPSQHYECSLVQAQTAALILRTTHTIEETQPTSSAPV
jgi:hypothetical protein